MADHTIIAIGRQFGSGGHEIGERLAGRLGIPFYDRNLVKMAAKELDISDVTAESQDEKALDNFLSSYMPVPGDSDLPESEPSLSEQVYMAQAGIIRRLAKKGPCIVVGRCADYILRDYVNCISVFICSSQRDKEKRIARLYDISERKAGDMIKKVDAERRYYYEAHTGRKWGSIESHQILLNVSLLEIDGAVDILEALFKTKEGSGQHEG